MLWWIWLLVIGYLLLSAFVIWQMSFWVKRARSNGHLGWLKCVIPVISALCVFPILGTFLPESPVASFFQKYGNIWIGLLGAFGIIMLFALIVRFFVRPVTVKYANIVLIIALAFAVLVNGYGMIHAKTVVTKKYQVEISADGAKLVKNKKIDKNTEKVVRVAFISDTHMGVNSSLTHIQKMIHEINEADVDVVLGGGDYFTSTYIGLTDAEIWAAVLGAIKSKNGGYYALGNHDVTEKLFCGFAITPKEQAIRYLEMDEFFKAAKWNIKQDEIVEINGVQYVFRKDGEKTGDGINKRMSVEEIMSKVDTSKPVVVIEHEPDELTELNKAGADLVLSGHTHNGQIAPANIYGTLVEGSYSNNYGAKKFGKMLSIVSSGIGFYGPPIRIGTDSEVVIIDMILK